LIKSSDLQYWKVANGSGLLVSKMTSGQLNNFLPSLTGVQNRDLNQTTYVFAIVNNHASLALTSARIYFRQLDPGGATLSMALDTRGVVNKNGPVWDSSNAPTSFVTPTTIGTGLAVASLTPGFAISVWVRRVATASGAKRPEKNTITITGTSAA
jgi:hypothetical protein